jgi:hypothetical protein
VEVDVTLADGVVDVVVVEGIVDVVDVVEVLVVVDVVKVVDTVVEVVLEELVVWCFQERRFDFGVGPASTTTVPDSAASTPSPDGPSCPVGAATARGLARRLA